MNDLVIRHAVIDTVEGLKKHYDGKKLDFEIIGYNVALNDAKEAVRSMPSAEPERKKGRWIKMSDADGVYWSCSECGEDIPRVSHFDPQFDLFPKLKSIDPTAFCPNCGAKMKGEEDE